MTAERKVPGTDRGVSSAALCRWCGHIEPIHMHGPDCPGRCREEGCRCQGFLKSDAALCPSCGGPLTTENFAEATITTGKCGYSWAAHFGGGEVQTKPCRKERSDAEA